MFAAAVGPTLSPMVLDTSRTNTFQCSCEERVHMVGDHMDVHLICPTLPGYSSSAFSLARAFLPVVLDRQSMTANGVRA